MERYDIIVKHPLFQKYLREIEELEQNRIYCRHNLIHLLDVARIAYIINLEQRAGFAKDVIYGAALLHDIGKTEQYLNKIPHEITGAVMAEQILFECGYSEEEINLMKTAILDHRKGPKDSGRTLSQILYEADKKSRMCLFCQAENTCNWADENKNQTLTY